MGKTIGIFVLMFTVALVGCSKPKDPIKEFKEFVKEKTAQFDGVTTITYDIKNTDSVVSPYLATLRWDEMYITHYYVYQDDRWIFKFVVMPNDTIIKREEFSEEDLKNFDVN